MRAALIKVKWSNLWDVKDHRIKPPNEIIANKSIILKLRVCESVKGPGTT